MRLLTLDLARIEQALLGQDSLEHYLDQTNGAVLTILPGDPAPGAEEKYDVQPDRYLPIEPLTQAELLAMREAFLFALDEPHAHALLSLALAGRKPLRTFDYELERLPQVQLAWLAYQAEQLRALALEWLAEHDLEAVAEHNRP